MLQWAMARSNGPYVQPDARGRIQLPQGFRSYPLFRIETQGDALLLQPLEVKEPQASIWLHAQVQDFFRNEMEPQLKQWLKAHELSSAVLYGSRARGDAKNTSDFDIAVVTNKIISRKLRIKLEQSLNELWQEPLAIIRSHKVNSDVNLVTIPEDVPDAPLPSLFYSIAAEGVALAQSDKAWKRWLKQIEENKRKFRVKHTGHGKRRKWTWENKL